MKKYIVTVLDYAKSEVDVFTIKVKEEDNPEEIVQWAMEQFGHSTTSSCYMYTPIGKTKFHIDI